MKIGLRTKWRLKWYWSHVVLFVFALPKALSMLVPRRRGLILVGAGRDHVDNVIGVLTAKPAPPSHLRFRVVANKKNRSDPRLRAAVAALPHAKFVRRFSLPSLWASLRADWVLVPNTRLDVWRFWLGKARLVYINHGPWMKRFEAPMGHGWRNRFYDRIYGRWTLVLASTASEVSEYQRWMGPHAEVLDLGYPRSAVLDVQVRDGLDPHMVALWPTWKEVPDPTYSHSLARRVHDALLAAGIKDAVVDYRPHHLADDTPLHLGEAGHGRRPGLVVTDFSSVAFDQFYRGGKVLLYSRVLEAYLAQRGVRDVMEPWLRANMVEDEDDLVRCIVQAVKGRGKAAGKTASDPLHLRPFDSAAFWARLTS